MTDPVIAEMLMETELKFLQDFNDQGYDYNGPFVWEQMELEFHNPVFVIKEEEFAKVSKDWCFSRPATEEFNIKLVDLPAGATCLVLCVKLRIPHFDAIMLREEKGASELVEGASELENKGGGADAVVKVMEATPVIAAIIIKFYY